jgi:hypothetical protein
MLDSNLSSRGHFQMLHITKLQFPELQKEISSCLVEMLRVT